MKFSRLFFLLIFVFISCSTQKSNERGGSDSLRAFQADSGSFSIPIQSVPVNDELKTETATGGSIKILMTGTFHGDEVWEGAENENWYGLFSDDEGYKIRKAKITAERVVDGLLDDEEKGEKTGWQISTTTNEDPVVLITGIDLKERKVPVADIPGQIYPGDTVSFTFSGISYQMFATGQQEFDSVNNTRTTSEYELFISCTINGTTIVDQLVSHAAFDDAMTSILWAGDIDGDNRLDLIIDLSNHYNARSPSLFLSGEAEENDLIILVAEFTSVGC